MDMGGGDGKTGLLGFSFFSKLPRYPVGLRMADFFIVLGLESFRERRLSRADPLTGISNSPGIKS